MVVSTAPSTAPPAPSGCRRPAAPSENARPGDAVITDGFDLPARFIIHTVGPIWRDGTVGEPETLAACYRNTLRVADEVGARSVAFPAISTGAYRYPPGLAAEVAVTTARAADTDVTLIRFVAFDGAMLARVPRAARLISSMRATALRSQDEAPLVRL